MQTEFQARMTTNTRFYASYRRGKHELMDNVGPIPLISCPNETVRAMLMPDELWGRETVVRGYSRTLLYSLAH